MITNDNLATGDLPNHDRGAAQTTENTPTSEKIESLMERNRRTKIALAFFDSCLCARLHDGETDREIENDKKTLETDLRLSFLLADEFIAAEEQFPQGFAAGTSIFKEETESSPTQ